MCVRVKNNTNRDVDAGGGGGGGGGGGAGVAGVSRLEWLPRGKSSVTQYAGIYPLSIKTHIYGLFIQLYCCMCVLTAAMYVSSYQYGV